MTTPAPVADFQLLDDDATAELFALDANELGRLPRDLENLAQYLTEYAKATMTTLELANATDGSQKVAVADVLARPSFTQCSLPFAVRLGTTASVFDAWVWEDKSLAIVPELQAIAAQEEGSDRWIVVSAKQLFWHLNDSCTQGTITVLFDQIISWLHDLTDGLDTELEPELATAVA